MEMGSSERRWIACVALCALAGSQPAPAQPAPGSAFCDARALPDLRIQNCTAVINSPRVNQGDRATAYGIRGIAWKAKGDLDRAIADFTEAIRLHPTNASTYNGRGALWQAKGNLE